MRGAGQVADHGDPRQAHQLAELLEAQVDSVARHQRTHRNAGRRLHDARRDLGRDAPALEQPLQVHAAGPGGVWIVSPEGKHLGTIEAPETPANIAWGDEDGRTLYMTARTGLYRIRLEVPGIRPGPTTRTARSGQ